MAFFGLTGSYQKQNSTENSTTNENSTSTPNTPDWMSGAWQDIFKNAGILGAAPPTSYVAGASPLQGQAFDWASTLGQGGSPLLGDAASMAKGAVSAPFSYNPATVDQAAQIGDSSHATGATAFGGINNYLNPYTESVVNSTIGDLNRARQLTTEGNGQGAIGAGQYGSSRQGVLDANANRDFYDRVGAATGGLRAQGFTTALGAADSDASRAQQASMFNASADNTKNQSQAGLNQQVLLGDQAAKNGAWQFNAGQGDTAMARQLQAAGLVGNIGTAQGTDNRANLGLLGDLGGVQQGIDQAQAAAPLTLQQWLAQMYGAAPTDAFVGQTNTGTSHTAGTRTGSGFSLGASAGVGSK